MNLNEKIEEIKQAAENYENEYEYYGIRFHRGNVPAVGETLPNSFDWVDGEIQGEELNGTSCIDINGNTELINEYVYGEGEIIIIAGYSCQYGEDEDELIISDAVRIY